MAPPGLSSCAPAHVTSYEERSNLINEDIIKGLVEGPLLFLTIAS